VITLSFCVPYSSIKGSGAQEHFEGYDRLDLPVELDFICAIVNSKFMTQFFRHRFATGALQGSYSDVWPQSVRDFPICRVDFRLEFRQSEISLDKNPG
jgi:hypothetical protein